MKKKKFINFSEMNKLERDDFVLARIEERYMERLSRQKEESRKRRIKMLFCSKIEKSDSSLFKALVTNSFVDKEFYLLSEPEMKYEFQLKSNNLGSIEFLKDLTPNQFYPKVFSYDAQAFSAIDDFCENNIFRKNMYPVFCIFKVKLNVKSKNYQSNLKRIELAQFKEHLENQIKLQRKENNIDKVKNLSKKLEGLNFKIAKKLGTLKIDTKDLILLSGQVNPIDPSAKSIYGGSVNKTIDLGRRRSSSLSLIKDKFSSAIKKTFSFH